MLWRWIVKKILPVILPIILSEVKKWLEGQTFDSRSPSGFSERPQG